MSCYADVFAGLHKKMDGVLRHMKLKSPELLKRGCCVLLLRWASSQLRL